MTYSSQIIRVTWLYQIAGTAEIADTSLQFTGSPGWNLAAAALGGMDTDTANDVCGLMAEFLDPNLNLSWADYSDLIAVKIAAVGIDGHYLTEPILGDTTSHRGSARSVLPQATIVLSLRTASSFGGGNFGRMYLPHTALPMIANSAVSEDSTTSALASAAADFLDAVTERINLDSGSVIFPAVMSQGATPSGKKITKVLVGRVTDTQRRRRNRLDEGYSTNDLS
jgi:hypothetical protein